MPVIDVVFDKLEVNRSVKRIDLKSEIKISNNFGLKDIKKEKLPGLGESAVVSFEYNTKYDPEIGNIQIEGRVIYNEKSIKNVLKEGKGKLVLKEKPFEEVNNAILRASTIQAMLLAKEMRMSSPVQLPKVQIEQAKVSKK